MNQNRPYWMSLESTEPRPEGRVTLIEDGRDIIVKISKPYLEFTRSD